MRRVLIGCMVVALGGCGVEQDPLPVNSKAKSVWNWTVYHSTLTSTSYTNMNDVARVLGAHHGTTAYNIRNLCNPVVEGNPFSDGCATTAEWAACTEYVCSADPDIGVYHDNLDTLNHWVAGFNTGACSGGEKASAGNLYCYYTQHCNNDSDCDISPSGNDGMHCNSGICEYD